MLTVLADGAQWRMGLLVLEVGAALFGVGLWQPHTLRRLCLPNALTQGRLIVLTLVDTFAACLALHLMFPDADFVPIAVLLPAFLLALGAGLASGSPGRVGQARSTVHHGQQAW